MLLGAAGVGAQQHKAPIYRDDLFQTMDENGDGVVDRMEYMLSGRDSLDESGFVEKDMRQLALEWGKRLYDAADFDGDGFLSRMEVDFGQYLNAEASRQAQQTGRMDYVEDDDPMIYGGIDASRVHKTIDVDRDGGISIEEFGVISALMLSKLDYDEYVRMSWEGVPIDHAIFRKADVDVDGRLDWRELQFAIWLMSDNIAHELANTLMEALDGDSDGKISAQEVADFLSVRRHMGGGTALERAATYVRDGLAQADQDGDALLDGLELLRPVREYLGDRTGGPE